VNFDSLDSAIPYFYNEYGDFFDIFNENVINIGPASQRYYASYLSMFVNDIQNDEVYEYTQKIFPDLNDTEEVLSDAFKRYIYYFPDSIVPEIVAYVSRFNHKIITVGNYIGVGLDQYLGPECTYYDMLRIPEYIQYNKRGEKIPSDLIQVWGALNFPYNDSSDNVLSRMVYQGLMLYFTDALVPEMNDSLKIGFSASQLKFCTANEKQMWTYLVENKLLFSTDPLVIKKLTEPAPFTTYFPKESPGRASVWLGWQIVREYARRNKNLSVPDILNETDYQKILRASRYNP